MIANAAPLRIFLAYSETDGAFAEQLASDLRKLLGRTGEVHAESPVGRAGDATAWGEVQALIAGADVYIIVLSPASMSSPWINAQIDIAWGRRAAGLLILPLRYRASEIREDLALLQFVSFLPPREYAAALGETRAQIAKVQAMKDASVQMRISPLDAPSLPLRDVAPATVPPQPSSRFFISRRSLMPLLSVALLGVVLFASLLLAQHKVAADQSGSLAARTQVASGHATRIARTYTAFQTQIIPTLTAISLTSTVAVGATATSQAATAIAQSGKPYSAAVPNCPADANWGEIRNPDPQHPTFICNNDNLQLLSRPANNVQDAELLFSGHLAYQGGLPAKHDTQIGVYDLQANGQDARFAFTDGLFYFGWESGYWSVTVNGSPTCFPCFRDAATLPSVFTIRIAYDGQQARFYVNSVVYGPYALTTNYQTSSGISLDYGLASGITTFQSVSLRVKNFRFTPLP